MPTDINVADGKIGIWHRFDALDKAVVKDRNVLMSVADSESNAREQITTIWQKLGALHTPPYVTYFNREDRGKNAASMVPDAYPNTSNFNAQLPNLNWVWLFVLRFDFNIGGAAPTSITCRATPTPSGSPTDRVTSLVYPYTDSPLLVTGGVTYYASPELAPGSGTYLIQTRLSNSFGDGPYNTGINITVP